MKTITLKSFFVLIVLFLGMEAMANTPVLEDPSSVLPLSVSGNTAQDKFKGVGSIMLVVFCALVVVASAWTFITSVIKKFMDLSNGKATMADFSVTTGIGLVILIGTSVIAYFLYSWANPLLS